MFTTLRKHQRWLMLVIAALTIIAFAFLYNTTNMDRVGSNMVARIYGRNVMQVDVEKAVRNYQLAMALGQFELVRDLSGQAKTEDEAANNFIWNLMVLQHEAAALDVEPADRAILDAVKALPVFQTDGQFDAAKYASFMQEQLAPRGFTERQLESVIKDSLRLKAVKALVETPAFVAGGDIASALQRVAPADVKLVRFNAATIGKNIKVGDDEVAAAFEERKAKLNAPEKRSVRYVAFVLAPQEAEAKDKARVEALQKIATATGDFAQSLGDGGKTLADAAAARGLAVKTTPLFAPNGEAGAGLTGTEAEVVTAAAPVAFRLPPAPGNFEILQIGDNGYAVIEVAEVQPARPLTLEEARADIRADLIAGKRDAAVREAVGKALSAIRESLASGKSIDEAAKAAGLKTEEMKGLSVLSQDLDAAQRQVAAAVMELPAASLGEFVPAPDGGYVPYVVSRGAPDAETIAKRRPMIEQGLLQGKKMLLFAQWLATAREKSSLEIRRPAM